MQARICGLGQELGIRPCGATRGRLRYPIVAPFQPQSFA